MTLLLLIPFVKGAMGTMYCKKCPPELFADHDFPVVHPPEEKGQGGRTDPGSVGRNAQAHACEGVPEHMTRRASKDWDRRSECEPG